LEELLNICDLLSDDLPEKRFWLQVLKDRISSCREVLERKENKHCIFGEKICEFNDKYNEVSKYSYREKKNTIYPKLKELVEFIQVYGKNSK
jgi:hypothetical protein